MAEETPRPKPGSLKDRIKQFETSSSTSSSSPAPPPLRPKPATLGQWKPKPVDPPSPTKQTNFNSSSSEITNSGQEEGTGLSASDAMSSIAKGGGSLKERMAALQGKGAFGAPASSSAAPSLPSSEGKPRVWRTSPAPPIVPRVNKENEGEPVDGSDSNRRSYASPSDNYKITEEPSKEGDEEVAADDDEEERERRAAIAARMARLGGARLGGPIGFEVTGASKSEGLQPKIISSDDAGDEHVVKSPVIEYAEDDQKPRKSTLDTALQIPLPKSQGSLLSPGDDIPSESDATTSGKLVPPRSPAIPRSPDTMPMPALPKRAAGPRRKKSAREIKASDLMPDDEQITPPVPTTEKEEPSITSSSEQNILSEQELLPKRFSSEDLPSVAPSETATPPPPSPSILETGDEKDDDSQSFTDGPTIEIPDQLSHQSEADASLLTPRPSSNNEESVATSLSAAIAGALSNTEDEASTQQESSDPKDEENPEEIEEEARKRRVAEKMARLGAVNPFAPSGFSSPISPRAEKKNEDNEVKKESNSGGEAAQESKDNDDSSHVNRDPTHESEPNVPVLSLPAVTRSSGERTLANAHERSTIQPPIHSEPKELVARPNLLQEEGSASELEIGAEDDDVDYPMMSPVSTSTPGAQAQFFPRSQSPAHELPERHEEAEEHKVQDGESIDLPSSDYSSPPTLPPKHEVERAPPPPRRIGRPVPPPPPSFAIPNSPPKEETHEYPDTTPSLHDGGLKPSQPSAPISDHQSPDSPPHVNQNFTSPPLSVSPTPSPPPRRLFIRESAPSPPSLEERLGLSDSEENDAGSSDDDSMNRKSDGDDASNTPTIAESKPPLEASPIPASPPAAKTPPPVPTSPRPVVRRSIPPPPRHSLPPPPPPTAPETPPRQKPQPPKQGQSLMMVSHDDSGVTDMDDAEVDYLVGDSPLEERRVDKEVMDDDEGDPVDPALLRSQRSPPRAVPAPPPVPVTPIAPPVPAVQTQPPRSVSVLQAPPRRIPSPVSSPPKHEEEKEEEEGEESEALRRRTIAERMAKLGGIKFGMPVPARPPPVRRAAEPEEEEARANGAPKEISEETTEADNSGQTPEESDRARRAAIASRMAAMGGRGFGMYGPTGVPAPTASVSSEPSPQATARPPPPLGSPPPIPSGRPKHPPTGRISEAMTRAAPPPPPPGVKGSAGGETSESELEMVNAELEDEEGEMVEQYEEEPEIVESPPPPPTRGGRPPIPPSARPPPPIPKPSAELLSDALEDTNFAPQLPPGRRAPPSRAPPPPAPPLQDYEILDGVSDTTREQPRPGHSRAIPPPPPPSTNLESSGQWELPAIPSGSFDLGGPSTSSMLAEQDPSWTKVERDDHLSVAPTVRPTSEAVTPSEPFSGPSPSRLSAEALLALAHHQGPRILQSAQQVQEKSKRLVIGDGSSPSFLYMVLAPTGASTTSLGHLIYAQNGGSIQKRLSDILPGDVVALYDAKFKGHKGGLGLGNYSASWGTETEPILGVVIEFEGKKSKIRAFAVNQHPNAYPTIDTPSYKLDDLKSGTVKVFRPAESTR
ncbi:hypothetical protein FRC14_005438 [Serendipita sp. 396]|nr:hypothetical protein FRC14_005438 [Serendipita sp. 396]